MVKYRLQKCCLVWYKLKQTAGYVDKKAACQKFNFLMNSLFKYSNTLLLQFFLISFFSLSFFLLLLFDPNYWREAC